MNDLEEFEIGLLYKSLVILKEKDEQETSNSTVVREEEKPTPIEVKTEVAQPPAEEKIVTETLNSKLFIYPKNLEETLRADNSNLSKILQALQASDIMNNAIHLEDISTLDQLKDVQVVWSVGLSQSQQESITKFGHLKYLNSPNPESLQTKEEKRKMYEPLKAFVKYFN
ncbi:MAG: hypothetical protein JXR19_09055 [Bacteroidia bacterium]